MQTFQNKGQVYNMLRRVLILMMPLFKAGWLLEHSGAVTKVHATFYRLFLLKIEY